jgi:hypothetical protein
MPTTSQAAFAMDETTVSLVDLWFVVAHLRLVDERWNIFGEVGKMPIDFILRRNGSDNSQQQPIA